MAADLSGGGLSAGKPGTVRLDLISPADGSGPEVGSGVDCPIRNDEQAGSTSGEKSGQNVTGLTTQTKIVCPRCDGNGLLPFGRYGEGRSCPDCRGTGGVTTMCKFPYGFLPCCAYKPVLNGELEACEVCKPHVAKICEMLNPSAPEQTDNLP